MENGTFLSTAISVLWNPDPDAPLSAGRKYLNSQMLHPLYDSRIRMAVGISFPVGNNRQPDVRNSFQKGQTG